MQLVEWKCFLFLGCLTCDRSALHSLDENEIRHILSNQWPMMAPPQLMLLLLPSRFETLGNTRHFLPRTALILVGQLCADKSVFHSAGAVESTRDAPWTHIHAFKMHPIWFGSDSKNCTTPAANPRSSRILIVQLRDLFDAIFFAIWSHNYQIRFPFFFFFITNFFYPVNATHLCTFPHLQQDTFNSWANSVWKSYKEDSEKLARTSC